MISRLLTVTVAACALGAGNVGPWPAAPAAAMAQPAPMFRTSTSVVRIDVFAHHGQRPIEGLTAADFLVRDNGIEQTVHALGTTDSAHVVVGLDLSGSVHGEVLESLRAAVHALVAQLTPNDRVSLFTFADRLQVHARAAAPDAHLGQAVVRVDAAGSTTLHDGVVLGSMLARADQRPAVFLLFTDGQETASWTTPRHVLDVLRRTDVVVYTVAAGLPRALMATDTTLYFQHPTWLPPAPGDTLRLLRLVADLTGGEFLRVDRDARLQDTFAGILRQYRQRYLLSFTPTGVKSGDGWHRLDVRLRGKPGAVVAREGYMAGPTREVD
jgi:VWFA-related protein